MASQQPTRKATLSLYRGMIRASRSFASYNFRLYFIRNTRAKFRLAAVESDPARTKMAYDELSRELAVLKRAAVVNRLFEGPKLIIEKPKVIIGGGGAGMEASAGGGVGQSHRRQ
ncbi:uncharacterized protein EI90DRAFT_3094998 [Cantharellus anzutake]|uniref:uncharacterized protein n=1 Tax=Cantharellus anzutake TaxID=1750568 RepID=UPI001907AD5E|nr:uncharacterized protein EI90DRAFT_3094998 [Cantharellus anzutake]KAF8311927.1 hypothetical protein EI90DRAFT_3094998 [Cantharellus anzutake]